MQKERARFPDKVSAFLETLPSWVNEISLEDSRIRNMDSRIENRTLPPVKLGNIKEGKNEMTSNVKEQDKRKAVEAKDKGNQYFKRGRYKEAIQLYTRAHRLDSTNAIPLSNRAMVYLRMEKYIEAEQDCTSALSLDPSYIKAIYRRGLARFRQKNLDGAQKDFEAVITLDTKNLEAPKQLKKVLSCRENMSQQINKTSPVIMEVTDNDNNNNSPTTQKDMKDSPISNKTLLKDTSSKKSSNSTLPKKLSILVDIPEYPPKTSFEFEQYWNELKEDISSFYKYFKLIEPMKYKHLFQNSLSSDIFSSIINAIEQFGVRDSPKNAIDMLTQLTKVSRFSMLVLFMSSKDNEGLKSIFSQLEMDEELNKVEINLLKKEYGCDK